MAITLKGRVAEVTRRTGKPCSAQINCSLRCQFGIEVIIEQDGLQHSVVLCPLEAEAVAQDLLQTISECSIIDSSARLHDRG